jgi:hypothetical protein
VRRARTNTTFQTQTNQEIGAGISTDPVKLPDKMFNEQCPICIEDFAQGDHLAGLECGHQYHEKCFEDWMKSGHLSCPTCRARPQRNTRAGRFAQVIFS